MNIKEQALEGKIIFVPLNGSPRYVDEIPDGMTPHYSGAVLILAGEQEGDVNITLKSEFKLNIKGDAVVLSQAVWHENNS